jgi:IclR family pca regulon transcriptional regulator
VQAKLCTQKPLDCEFLYVQDFRLPRAYFRFAKYFRNAKLFPVEEFVSSDGGKRDREVVAGLARGLKVIEAFNEGDGRKTLSEVARLTSLSPAAARRSLRTLASLGYVRSIDRQYLLNARVLSLGAAYLRSADIESALMPELRRLVGLFGDTAGIAVLVGNNILYVAHHCTARGLRPVAGPGVMYPAYATSLGRVLLASLDDDALDDYFANVRLEKFTKVTDVNARRLRSTLLQIRRQGYGTIVDQLFYGVTSLTVPVFDKAGGTIAALNTSTYTGHMTGDELIRSRLAELRRSSEHLTRIIGNHASLEQALRTGPECRGPTFAVWPTSGVRSKQSQYVKGERNGRKAG